MLYNHWFSLCLKVLFATCFDPKILSELEQNEGKVLSLKPASVDISYR
jgi:alpha-glucan,water dikinase